MSSEPRREQPVDHETGRDEPLGSDPSDADHEDLPAADLLPADPGQLDRLLRHGDVEVVGRLVQASNATLLVRLELDGVSTRAVYKPVRGERPLWDFPHGTLADREVATHVLAAAAGWDVVPLTVPRLEAPFGPGSMQVWVDETEGEPLVDVVGPAGLREGWLVVLQAESELGEPLLLVHRDDPRLRRMALLDAVVNNADRKGGHVLHATDGTVRGVDHGLTYNTDDKLRTVLWGWAGEPLSPAERDVLEQLDEDLEHGATLAERLGELLRADEVARTRERVHLLLVDGVMPEPSRGWPSIPWPAL